MVKLIVVYCIGKVNLFQLNYEYILAQDDLL